MSEEYEYDPFEYAQALAEGQDLGHSDLSEARNAQEAERRGLTRRDLLVKGGVGAAAVGGLGAFAGRRRREAGVERQVHRHAARAHSRRRVPDPGHREAGLEGPRIHRQADPRSVREAAADRDHVAGHVRRLRRLQLPVASGLAVRQPPAGRHARGSRAGTPSTSSSRTASSTRPRHSAPSAHGNAPFRDHLRRPRRLDRPPGVRQRPGEQQADRPLDRRGRQADRRQAAAALHRRPGRRTSTSTRWATTPT